MSIEVRKQLESTLHSSYEVNVDHVFTESEAFSKSTTTSVLITRSKSGLFNRLIKVELSSVALRDDFHEQIVTCWQEAYISIVFQLCHMSPFLWSNVTIAFPFVYGTFSRD